MRMQGMWGRRGTAGTEESQDGVEGLRQLQAVAAQLQWVGELLTVTTPAQNGKPAFVRQAAFLPQPIMATTLTRLQFEAVIDVGSGMTTDFICAGDTAIVSGDLLSSYDGATWRVIGLLPESYAGETLLRHAIAQRQ